MSGTSGTQEEPAPKSLIRMEVERIAPFNHHREEVREARARWWNSLGHAVERAPGEANFHRPTD